MLMHYVRYMALHGPRPVLPTDFYSSLYQLIGANDSDLFYVLQYVSFANPVITREDRVSSAKSNIYNFVNDK